MDMSNISHLFQKSSVLRAGSPFVEGKQASKRAAAPGDVLQQISGQMITKQQGSVEAGAAEKAEKIKLDSYAKTDSAQPLEEMPREVLEYYLGVTKLFATSASRQEGDLTAFRDRLQGMDQAIQGYQDVLDGKSALPEGLKTEDITKSIAEAKQIRGQFFKDGAEHLNQWGDYFITSDHFDKLAEKVLGENKFAGKAASNWKLDASASDIYAEIDRVLAQTHEVTEELDRGVRKICDMLDERGFGNEYKQYLETWRADKSYFDQLEAKDVQQLMRDNLMDAPLQNARDSN